MEALFRGTQRVMEPLLSSPERRAAHDTDEVPELDDDELEDNGPQIAADADTVLGKKNWTFHMKLYALLSPTGPYYSNSWGRAAWCLHATVVVFVVLSAAVICLETVPYFHSPAQRRAFQIVELICIVVFTLELVARFVLAPSNRIRLDLFRLPSTWIDILSVIPFYIEFGINLAENDPGWAVLRILLLARVFKLARYSTGLVVFKEALDASASALVLLAFIFSLATLSFSTLVYITELQGCSLNSEGQWVRPDGNVSPFQTIPMTFWWALVSLTTVGYGDATPITDWGRISASACLICGVLMVVFPMLTLSDNFQMAYQRHIDIEALHEDLWRVIEQGESDASTKLPETLKERVYSLFTLNVTQRTIHERRLAVGIQIVVFGCVGLSCFAQCMETIPSLLYSSGWLVTFLHVVDITCTVVLTLEFGTKLLTAPHKGQFLQSPNKWIDILSFLPVLFQLLLSAEGWFVPGSSNFVFAIILLSRVLRVLRLAFYNKSVIVVLYALRASLPALSLMAFLVCVIIFVMGSAIYYVELGNCHWNPKEEAWMWNDRPDTKAYFQTIPTTFWFMIVTLSTTGYGDMFPVTFWGKAIDSFALFGSLLIISVPLSILSYTYKETSKIYQQCHHERQLRQQDLIRGREMQSFANEEFATTFFKQKYLPGDANRPLLQAAPPPVLQFQGVSLEEAPIVDLDMVANRGDFVCVFAPSAVDLHSLVHMTTGAEPPAAGAIFLDGTGTAAVSRDQLRHQVQHLVWTPPGGPPREVENVTLGMWLSAGSVKYVKHELEVAVRAAGLQRWLQQLPSSFDTLLRTITIAEWQWILLSIARVHYLRPHVLFVDGKLLSAHQDHAPVVLAALSRLMFQPPPLVYPYGQTPEQAAAAAAALASTKNASTRMLPPPEFQPYHRTVILLAHAVFSDVFVHADKVLVLNAKGSVTSEGKHAELLKGLGKKMPNKEPMETNVEGDQDAQAEEQPKTLDPEGDEEQIGKYAWEAYEQEHANDVWESIPMRVDVEEDTHALSDYF